MDTPSPMPELIADGLAVQAAFDLRSLPPQVREPVNIALAGLELEAYRTLVLLGQAGPLLWERHVRHNLHLADPFDEVSRELVTEWFSRHRPDDRWMVVYPGPYSLPLGRLAAAAGWGRPSPLGLTIHPRYGLWIAHRLAVVTSAAWPQPSNAPPPHPCVTCSAKPCESACPAQAVSFRSGFAVETCTRYRAQRDSPCAYRCLAREACPIGSQHRYGPDQMQHHYAAGLASIRSRMGLTA